MTNPLLDRIEINPQVMLGKPFIKGTRITVEILLNKLAQNISVDEILADYPRLAREDIQAALAYAAIASSMDEVLPLQAVSARISWRMNTSRSRLLKCCAKAATTFSTWPK